jgi:rhodanese-related sulfurtransferase
LGGSSPVLSEHIEQREYVQWFRQTYPGVRILAIPNGGARSPATAARLKAEGVCAGVPDLFVPEWGLWVEMKRAKGGKVSKDQKDWLDYLANCGYRVIVCLGKTDAINQTQKLRIKQ